MLDRLIRAFLIVGSISVACAWTWPSAFPAADPRRPVGRRVARGHLANLDIESFMDVGMWTLAVVPFFIAGMLASLKCGELASMLVTGGGAAGSGLMGMATTAKVGAGGIK